MKRFKLNVGTFFVLAITALFGFGCSVIDPGADKVVVNAQRTLASSFDGVDTFLKLEHDAVKAGLKVPAEVTSAANTLRVKFPPADKAANEALKLYKSTKSPENKRSLEQWITIVKGLADIAVNAKAELASP